MKCSEARKHISELVGENRSLKQHPETAGHVRHCDLCRRFYEDEILAGALNNMHVPEPDEKFSQRVIENAVNRYRKRSKRVAFAWFSAAAAILVAVFAAGIFQFSGMPALSTDSRQAEMTITEEKQNTVNILIEAEKDRKGAVFTVDLEGNIALRGMPGKRNFRWKEDLARGRNLLEIPVELADSSGGSLRVVYRYNGVEKEVRIVLRPSEAQNDKDIARI